MQDKTREHKATDKMKTQPKIRKAREEKRREEKKRR
jgi:hypothetical protein